MTTKTYAVKVEKGGDLEGVVTAARLVAEKCFGARVLRARQQPRDEVRLIIETPDEQSMENWAQTVKLWPKTALTLAGNDGPRG